MNDDGSAAFCVDDGAEWSGYACCEDEEADEGETVDVADGYPIRF